ncbi:MAG: glucose 1-dehydrogenase [Burkholderiaceae bacterium]|nr:glucose 1-dehydrogenase [Burkholderiaceae bacterium]
MSTASGRRFEGKTILITGAGSGIGRAAAMRFAGEGAQVVIADYNGTAADETAQLAAQRGLGAAVATVRGDVSVEADNVAMVDLAVARFGRLDFAFLNAGVGGAFGPIAETSVEDWDYTFHVLVRGVFLGAKHCSQAIRRHGQGGALVATASIAGLAGGAGSHAYSAAKAAVVSLTRSLAVELAEYRIRVNSVAPGTIMTPLLHRGRPEKIQSVLPPQPWPDHGEPENIAAVAAFLCSDDAAFITGETIVADGGRIAQGIALFGTGAGNVLMQRPGVNRGSTGEPSELRNTGR